MSQHRPRDTNMVSETGNILLLSAGQSPVRTLAHPVIMSCVCLIKLFEVFFFFSSRRRHTRWTGDWSSDVCSSDLSSASALPLPKPKTHFDLAGALAEGFLGGAFAGAAGLRGAALPAGRLPIHLIDLTMEFTDSVAPGRNDQGRRCRHKPGNLRAAIQFDGGGWVMGT